jgi:hypothetical protein
LHLTSREVEKLIDAATESSRNKERDRCLLLLSYRHGFRVSEICGLPLDHVDVEGRVLHVKRLPSRFAPHRGSSVCLALCGLRRSKPVYLTCSHRSLPSPGPGLRPRLDQKDIEAGLTTQGVAEF